VDRSKLLFHFTNFTLVAPQYSLSFGSKNFSGVIQWLSFIGSMYYLWKIVWIGFREEKRAQRFGGDSGSYTHGERSQTTIEHEQPVSRFPDRHGSY